MNADVVTRRIPPAATHALRHAVLWPSVPVSEQAQPYDGGESVHLGAFLGDNKEPVGVLTLVLADYAGPAPLSTLLPSSSPLPVPFQVQLRKFAVAGDLQGRGVGSAMLAAAVEQAMSMQGGQTTRPSLLHLDARVEQTPFYEKRGFRVLDDEVFAKKGPGGKGPAVEYVRMGRALQ